MCNIDNKCNQVLNSNGKMHTSNIIQNLDHLLIIHEFRHLKLALMYAILMIYF